MKKERELEIPEEIAKRRKHWLIVTLITASYPICYVLLLYLCYSKQISPDKFDYYFALAIVQIIIVSPFVYLLYYCAYKKFGNVCLVISMIGSFWSIGYAAFSFSRDLPCFFNTTIAITILLNMYWFVISRDLFKLNQICRKIKGIE